MPRAGFVVLKRVGPDRYRVIGEAARRAGATAQVARRLAIEEAIGRPVKAGEQYVAVLRSEWLIGFKV